MGKWEAGKCTERPGVMVVSTRRRTVMFETARSSYTVTSVRSTGPADAAAHVIVTSPPAGSGTIVSSPATVTAPIVASPTGSAYPADTASWLAHPAAQGTTTETRPPHG